MFDAQTLAFAARTKQVGRGTPCPPLCAPFGVLAGHIQLHSFCHSVKKSAFICVICGSNPVLKIKNLIQKIKTSSSNPIKPNQGFIDEKNSEFFSGHFDWKILGNQGKTAKKTPQKRSKNPRFLTDFCSSQFVNKCQRTPAFIASTFLPHRSATKTGQPSAGLAKTGLPRRSEAKTGHRFNASTLQHFIVSTSSHHLSSLLSSAFGLFLLAFKFTNRDHILRTWPTKT